MTAGDVLELLLNVMLGAAIGVGVGFFIGTTLVRKFRR